MAAAWAPAADLERLRARAALLAAVRAFFAEAGVMEVETQVLDLFGTTDPNIPSLTTTVHCGGRALTCHLHTSPEFQMKCLLAAGSGPIYQIARVFRDERGGRHLPEFTLLEWYRPGWDHHRLMDEVEALLAKVAGAPPASRCTYRALFQTHLDVDPHRADRAALRRVAAAHLGEVPEDLDRDALLDLLMGAVLEPRLGRTQPVLVYDYPATQAALARVRPGSPPVAERFELYWQGMELANGFHELTDPLEQERRFLAERAARRSKGLPDVPHDRRLLAALAAGLPPCAGVALGLDRLLMCMTGAQRIDEVVAFPLRCDDASIDFTNDSE